MNRSDEPRETYWDLLQDIARLQGRVGEDLIAWAQAYEAGGRAFKHSAETLDQMADVGRRLERHLETGPTAAVQQTLQYLTAPWRTMGGMPGAATVDPFSRFWEAWTAAMTRGEPPRKSEAERGESS